MRRKASGMVLPKEKQWNKGCFSSFRVRITLPESPRIPSRSKDTKDAMKRRQEK